MPKHEKTVEGRELILFSQVIKSKRNNGRPPNIRIQFSKNGTPWSRTGSPKKNETVRKATFRLFNELKTEIVGGNGSDGLAAEAKWPIQHEIEIFFKEFHTMLKSQSVET